MISGAGPGELAESLPDIRVEGHEGRSYPDWWPIGRRPDELTSGPTAEVLDTRFLGTVVGVGQHRFAC